MRKRSRTHVIETANSVFYELFEAADAGRLAIQSGLAIALEREIAARKWTQAEAAKAEAPDFLVAEIGPRLAKAPVKFRLSATLAAPGDPLDDATKPWPADRKTVDLGTITVSKVVEDSAAAEKELLFLPTNFLDGIEPSEHPVIQTRTDAYAVSYGRRTE